METVIGEQTVVIIIKLLEECLENDYSAEELRSKIRDMLRVLNHPWRQPQDPAWTTSSFPV